jgi:hypothetical protein
VKNFSLQKMFTSAAKRIRADLAECVVVSAVAHYFSKRTFKFRYISRYSSISQDPPTGEISFSASRVPVGIHTENEAGDYRPTRQT